MIGLLESVCVRVCVCVCVCVCVLVYTRSVCRRAPLFPPCLNIYLMCKYLLVPIFQGFFLRHITICNPSAVSVCLCACVSASVSACVYLIRAAPASFRPLLLFICHLEREGLTSAPLLFPFSFFCSFLVPPPSLSHSLSPFLLLVTLITDWNTRTHTHTHTH